VSAAHDAASSADDLPPVAGPPDTLLDLDTRWQALLSEAPDVAVIEHAGTVWTRRQFENLITQTAARWQAAGWGRQDIVAWYGLNTPQMLAALLAAVRGGQVLLPLNWRLAQAELLQVLRHAGVAGIDGSEESAPALASLRQAWAQASPQPVHGSALAEDALLVYTSGTTGQPKGAMHTRRQLAANAQAAISVQGLDGQTRALAVLPLFHVGGLCIQVLPTLMAGGVIRLHGRFDAGLWLSDVGHWRPSTSLLVPATMRAILEHPAWPTTPLDALAFVNSGSSVVPASQIHAFHTRGVPVAQVYGSTETGPFSIALKPAEALLHVGSTGTPAPGVEVRLLDAAGQPVPPGQVGQIVLRGANVMRGYHREPTHPDFVNGWFHSGDLACQTPDGRYTVVGRLKDMIISGGENIYPAEIENLIAALPGVAECAVVGMPDARWGEVPVLAVVEEAGCRLGDAELHEALAEQLARFKHPHRIVRMSALPKTALGKVVKPAVIEQITAIGSNPAD
jgi:fatty-acyl-CoA synthase